MARTWLALLIALVLGALAPPAQAWNNGTHRRMSETAVSIMEDPPLQTVFIPPSDISIFEWQAYLDAVQAAPAKLSVLRTGLPTSLPGSEFHPLAPAVGGPAPFPILYESCPHYDDDNLDKIGSIRIEEFRYLVDRSADPCGLTLVDNDAAKTKLVLGSVLGWQGQYPDDLLNDSVLWTRPTNAGFFSWAKKAAADSWKYGAGAFAAPFKCLWDLLFGDGCDIDSSFDLSNEYNPVLYADGWLPGFGDIRGTDYTGLWHFIDVRAGPGDYNDIRGMYYPDAGPTGHPGVVDYLVMAAADFDGLSLNAGASDGDDHYGDYDKVSRGDLAWQSLSIAHLEFSSLDNLALYGWDKFKLGGHKSAAGLAWPLHAIGDATEPHHVVGTSSHGHRPLEDAVDHSQDLVLPLGPPAQPSGEDYDQRRRILLEGYYWWKALHDSGGDVRSMIRVLAIGTLPMAGDWAFDDYASFEYLLPNGAGEISYYSKLPQTKPLLERGTGATLGFLAYVSEGAVDAGFDPNTKCPPGTHWDLDAGCKPGSGGQPPPPVPIDVCFAGSTCDAGAADGGCTPCVTNDDCSSNYNCTNGCCIGIVK
jgi:hypothetical protein